MENKGLTRDEVVEFFGGRRALAEALGISQPAISMWGDHVPKGRLEHVKLLMKVEKQRRAAQKKRKTA